MEGSKTEPVVYNSWINYVAPHMSQVKKLSDIKENNFSIIQLLLNQHPKNLEKNLSIF